MSAALAEALGQYADAVQAPAPYVCNLDGDKWDIDARSPEEAARLCFERARGLSAADGAVVVVEGWGRYLVTVELRPMVTVEVIGD